MPVKGGHLSEYAKQTLREKATGRKGYWNGKKHSPETRKKISQSKKGQATRKGVKLTESHKEKFRIVRRGEGNSNWRGGKSFEPYPLAWTETLKKAIRQRDNYTCQVCFKKQKKPLLSIHHIDYDKNNLDPSNLISLCVICHSKTNHNRVIWPEKLRRQCESILKVSL